MGLYHPIRVIQFPARLAENNQNLIILTSTSKGVARGDLLVLLVSQAAIETNLYEGLELLGDGPVTDLAAFVGAGPEDAGREEKAGCHDERDCCVHSGEKLRQVEC